MTLDRVVEFRANRLLDGIEELLADSAEACGSAFFSRKTFIDQLESCLVNRFTVDQTLAVGCEYVIIEVFGSCSCPSCFIIPGRSLLGRLRPFF